MERPVDAPPLAALATAELASLRLAAQVMAHRAQLAGRPVVALYFESLETAVLAEEAGRAQHGHGGRTELPPAGGGAAQSAVLDATAGTVDRRLIGEYLALITGNDRLSPAVRNVCRGLLARYAE